MNNIVIFFASLIGQTRQETGQGLTEYAVILMLVAIVVIAALTLLGVTLDTAYYDRLASELLSG